MDAYRKNTFRELIYWGLVEIKLATSPRGFTINPVELWQRHKCIAFAHETAEWLHNLAQFSSLDFERFDESLFWKDYGVFRKKYPLDEYQSLFDKTLQRLQTSQI